MSSVKPPDSVQAGEGAPPFLQIKRIIKQYDDVFAVDDVSLNIQKGEIFALLGSSGCGKSTLLRMLAGFEVPTSGQIVLEGRDSVGPAPYAWSVSHSFQPSPIHLLTFLRETSLIPLCRGLYCISRYLRTV